MWVVTWKSDETGKVVKAKARLVDRGCSRSPGVYYNETFARTTPCIRLRVDIACKLRVYLCHIDVQQALVQAELKKVVLMRMPKGCGALSGR